MGASYCTQYSTLLRTATGTLQWHLPHPAQAAALLLPGPAFPRGLIYREMEFCKQIALHPS